MSKLNKLIICIIYILPISLALSACENNNFSASTSTYDLNTCKTLLDEIDQQAFINADKPLDDYLKSRIEMARKECPKSFERDFSIAQLLAASNLPKESINLLNSMNSNVPEEEIKRLHLLFWIYMYEAEGDKISEVVKSAASKYPDNSYTLMMESISKCYFGSCKDELNQLIKLDQEIQSIPALPFLALAYAQNSDFKNASITFDRVIKITGINGLSDISMYAAVVSNINLERYDKAKYIYNQYIQANPNINSVYVNNANTALGLLGLLDNEKK